MSFQSLIVAIVIVVCIALPCETLTPGFSSFVGENALQYMCHEAVPIVEAKVKDYKLSDVDRTLHTPIGNVDFKLSEIHIGSFAIGKLNTKIVENIGMRITVQDVFISVKSNWKYRECSFPHISDHGTADISMNMTSSILVLLSHDASGHLLTKIDQNILIELSNLQISLHGGASWLYNIFMDVLSGTIKDAIDRAMRDMILGTLNQRLQNILSSISYVVPVGPKEYHLQVDFSVVQTILNASNSWPFLSIGNRGVIEIAKPEYIPYPGLSAPYVPYKKFTSNQPMIQIILTDYFIATAAWSVYQDGILQTLIQDSDIPPYIPIRMNTEILQIIAPGLSKYPNRPMQLLISNSGTDFTKAPHVTINMNGITLTTMLELTWNVVSNDSSIVQAFVLNVTLEIDLKASVQNGNRINTTIHLDKIMLGVESSHVGPVDVKGLDTFVRMLFQFLVVPYVNIKLEPGFPIPIIDGIELTNPQIIFAERFVAIISNFKYNALQALQHRKN
jgi:lipopolysaccharide-binding protein